uniref:Uncharacterized protein n=1 Tax=Daphnia galeata TaxID=27404 RepID=A0A8J2WL51_9CRUS|nr:unnamed protein product [Daphnia galeata]
MLEKEPENRISSAEVVDQLMKIKKITISHFLKRRNANYVIEEFNILIQEGIEIDVDERGLTTLLHLFWTTTYHNLVILTVCSYEIDKEKGFLPQLSDLG